ncbi:MAG: gamma-glutamylcyclotransferase [Hyphomicrobiaceae bacterium]
MSRVSHIVTYGTLMSTCRGALGRPERALMLRHARLLGITLIPGQLFCAGACPAALTVDGRTNRRDRIHCELWSIHSDAGTLLDQLDRYEGCAVDSPQPSLYQRRRVQVTTPNGRRVTAWLYEWTHGTEGLRLVPEGRWLESKQNHREGSTCTAALTMVG